MKTADYVTIRVPTAVRDRAFAVQRRLVSEGMLALKTSLPDAGDVADITLATVVRLGIEMMERSLGISATVVAPPRADRTAIAAAAGSRTSRRGVTRPRGGQR